MRDEISTWRIRALVAACCGAVVLGSSGRSAWAQEAPDPVATAPEEPEEPEKAGKPEKAEEPEQPGGGSAVEPEALDEEGAASSRREAREGDAVVVVMQSGEKVQGEFVGQSERELEVKVASVTLRIDRSTVERVIVLDPPRERYKRMRALIGDEDVDRLLMLADWLRREKLYEESLREIEHVLTVAPNDGTALRLRAVVENLLALERRGRAQEQVRKVEGAPQPAEAPAGSAAATRPRPGEFPVLRPDQIALMKVYEVDLRDPPKMVVEREVIDRLIRDHGDNPLIPTTREGKEALYRMAPAEILDLMFRVRARELYERVQVLELPRSIRKFRDQVHATWLVNTCATTRCHGGSQSGRLRLTNYRPTSDESVFTNLLILERFRTASGEPLIDYAEPERSVLLQMGLPRDDSLHPHPVVPGWTPAFRNREARRFAQAVDWIRSMYRPRPEYPVEYSPPGETLPTGGEGGLPLPSGPVER